VGAGIFAALAVCLLVMLFILIYGINNMTAPGAEMPVNPVHRGIYAGQVFLVGGFAVGGALLGMVHNLDASPAGRTLAIARGAFFGGLLLVVGSFLFFLASAVVRLG
jgi:hypothetical protein